MTDMDRIVPRVIDANDSTELFTLAHQITSTPSPLSQVDGMAVMPGLGEHKRVTSAVDAWQANPQTRHLFVAGTNGGESTQAQPTLEWLLGDPANLKRIDGVETQVSAEHTRDQAEWLVHQIRSREIGSLALFVSHWHLPRAYSTVIKTMLDQKGEKPIPIFPVAVATSPYFIIPETGVTAAEMSAGEAKRIGIYREMGHVASPEEMDTYLAWLWEQSTTPIE